MELTTGAILRRITETPLSTSAHKLAPIILDGIAWKEGYNGLERGKGSATAACVETNPPLSPGPRHAISLPPQ